jgi:hypothetical protein
MSGGSEGIGTSWPFSSISTKDQKMVEACPEGHAPISYQFNGNNVIRAYFDKNACSGCARQEACPVEIRKNNDALRVEQKEVITGEVRQKLEDKSARQEATSKRAAIEGTNSSLKRSQGAGRLNVRGKVKATLVIGMKIIGHNFKQVVRFFKGKIAEEKRILWKKEE